MAAFLAAISLFCDAHSKDSGSLQIGKIETLNAAGLKFKQFKDSVPLPPVEAASLKLKSAKGDPIFGFKPKDLWIAEETVLRWKNPAGTVTLARMSLPIPEPEGVKIIFKEKETKYCTEDDFRAWKNEAKPSSDDKSVIAWLNYLCDEEFKPPTQAGRGGGKVPAIRKFFAKKENSLVWAFELTQPANKDFVPFFFIFKFDKPEDISKNEKTIKQFLSSISFLDTPKSAVQQKEEPGQEADKKAEQEDVRALSPELASSRDSIVKGISGKKGWWHQELENFIVLSNIANREKADAVFSLLEPAFKIFSEYYPGENPPKAFRVCRLFQTTEGYEEYVGAENGTRPGLWLLTASELVVSPQRWASAEEKGKFISSVVFHEGFLQHLFHTSGNGNAPWFAEGNAAFFEGVELRTRGRYGIVIPADKLEAAARLASAGKLPLEQIVGMDYAAFSAAPNRDDCRTAAWAIVYYLRKGCQIMNKRRDYEDVLSRYYDEIRKNHSPAGATEFAFKEIDRAKFFQDLLEFFRKDVEFIRKSESADPVRYLSSEPKKKGSWWENLPEDSGTPPEGDGVSN